MTGENPAHDVITTTHCLLLFLTGVLLHSDCEQILQAIIQFAAALVLFQTTPKRVTLDKLSISPAVVSFISLLVGEIGRLKKIVVLLCLLMHCDL